MVLINTPFHDNTWTNSKNISATNRTFHNEHVDARGSFLLVRYFARARLYICIRTLESTKYFEIKRQGDNSINKTRAINLQGPVRDLELLGRLASYILLFIIFHAIVCMIPRVHDFKI